MVRIKPHNLQFGSILLSFISLFIIIYRFDNLIAGYRLMTVFPVAYCIGSVIASKKIFNTDYRVSVIMYFFIQGLRFVVMPAVIALAGSDCGSPYIMVYNDSLETACIIMIFEYIVCTFAIVVWASKRITDMRQQPPRLTTNWPIYVPYVLLSIIVYLYFSRKGNILSFITLSAGTNIREGDLTDTTLIIARQIVLIAIIVMFLSLLSFSKRKYDLTHNSKYLYLSIVAAILNICVIVGERRTTQIYAAFCCAYCLSIAFPERRKSIYRYIYGSAFIVLVFMTIYKFSYAFLYTSYSDAIAATDLTINSIARSLQAYFNGPQNVAVCIELDKVTSFGPWNFLYDVLRSTVPISFLVKNMGTLVSYSFNNYIYGGNIVSGHLLSSVGDGYLCFSPFLCYLVMMLNIKLAMYCENKMKRAQSYEMIYIWGYLLLRFCFGYSLNTPGLLNSSSIMLLTGGLLFKVARTIRVGKVQYHDEKINV